MEESIPPPVKSSVGSAFWPVSKIILHALVLLLSTQGLFSQYVTEHISKSGIYRLLDELGELHYIELHSLMKPYSRQQIAEWLMVADSSRETMDPGLQAELDFYLKDFSRDLPVHRKDTSLTSWLWQNNHGEKRFDMFYYSDSRFNIAVNPILGGNLWVNENGTFHHWWNGVEGWATLGRFAFWVSLRDNHESVHLTRPDFQNQRIGGGRIIGFDDRLDYEELRAGITYQWKWGHVGVIMDQFAWGENNAGANIFSGRTPSYPRIELGLDPVKWFTFRYVHGSLYSGVVDSTHSFWVNNAYGTFYKEITKTKYLAANMFSFTPVSRLDLSIGNSVIYDTPVPNLGFLIPLAFFKAIDHSLNPYIDNMNSQMFLSISSRNIRRIHLHGTVFIDELATKRFFQPDQFNFLSFKAGFSALPHPRLRLAAEYTWTNTLTFMHFIPTTTFESSLYNLGHYLEDNAKDLYLELSYRPFRTLRVTALLNRSIKGPDHTDLGTPSRAGIRPFEPVVWESTKVGIVANMQLINDLFIRLGWEARLVEGTPESLQRWTPEVYHGRTNTLQVGINYGF